MNEHEFLIELEQRAKENEQLIKKLATPKVFFYLSIWFGDHPWRIMIPFSFLITLILRLLFGKQYFEFILRILGGL